MAKQNVRYTLFANPEKDITNEKCLNAPQERVHEKELCPFAQLWKTWGLLDKTPYKESNITKVQPH